MKYILTLLLFLSYSSLFTQNNDSITNILDESLKLIENNPIKSSYLAEKAKKKSQTNNYQRGIIVSNNILGVINFYKGKHKKSIEYYSENVTIAKEIENNDLLATSYLNIGNAYSNLGKYTVCVKMFTQALKFVDDDDETKLSAYQHLADVHNIVKQYKKAIESLEKAYKIATAENNSLKNPKTYQASILISLGVSYSNLGDKKEAFKYYKKAEKIFNKPSKKDNYQSSDLEKINLYNSLSTYYLDQDNVDSALIYAIKAEKLTNARSFDILKPTILILLGDTYFKKQKYNLAERYYIDAEMLLKTVKDKDLESNLAHGLSKFYAKINSFSKAYKYAEKHITLNDSISNVNNVRILSDITASYEAEKKDNEINIQKLKIKKQENLLLQQQRKNILNYIIIGFVIIVLIISVIFYKNKQRIRTQEIKRLKAENKVAKLDATLDGQNKERERIAKDLHDSVSGNLAAIKLKLTNLKNAQSKEIDAVISNLDTTYNEVRTISHNLLPQKIITQNFTKNIEQLVSLYRSDNLKIGVEIFPEEEINKLPQKIEIELSRILQELITNITKHAQASKCNISITLHDRHLNLIVEDNGIGFNTENKSKGIGLSNILSRIQSMNGSLDIDSSIGKGTTVNINVLTN